MTAPAETRRRIAVLGGGISGLAAAHRLCELDRSLQVQVLEAGGRLGGVVQTERHEGLLIERSADMFATKPPWALELCRRLGLADQLIETNAARRRALVVHRGRLYPVPEGFTLMSPMRMWPIVTTRLLSLRGKLRLAGERWVPPKRDDQDESLAAFATRRLGRECYERLVQPLVGGIYTADPQRLSMRAAMPQFVEMEQDHGSLIRAARRTRQQNQQQASGARYGMFVAFPEGLSTLVAALEARLPAGSVRLQTPATGLRQRPDRRWDVEVGENGRAEPFDAVIVALPAPRAARVLQRADSQLAADLDKIPYASAAITVLAYRRDQIAHPLDGFGFVVPQVEHRQILAGSFASNKFPGRAPEDTVLMRIFVGGACQPELVELPDEELQRLVFGELAELLGVHGQPLLCQIYRWRQAMPQYHVGHLELIGRIEQRAAALPRLALAGNAYHGVGIPQCVHSGELAAEQIVAGGG